MLSPLFLGDISPCLVDIFPCCVVCPSRQRQSASPKKNQMSTHICTHTHIQIFWFDFTRWFWILLLADTGVRGTYWLKLRHISLSRPGVVVVWQAMADDRSAVDTHTAPCRAISWHIPLLLLLLLPHLLVCRFVFGVGYSYRRTLSARVRCDCCVCVTHWHKR
jgi:hypothetical protein